MQKFNIGFFGATCACLVAIPSVAHAAHCSDGHYLKANAVTPGGERVDPDSDCVERDIFLMPGVQTVYFHPTAGLGPFYGGGVQIAPWQMSHNNDHFGPSQISTIAQVSILQSPNVSGSMMLFEAGATASLERNSSRRWLIPYFGGTLGGLTQANLGTSTYAYAMGGVHLFYYRDLMLDAEGGYHFPFSDIDQLKGPRAQLSMRFSLW